MVRGRTRRYYELIEVENNELHAQLAQKVDNCWSAYVDRLLKLSPSAVISMADEIAAADFCYDQLTACADRYPDELLEHLLRFDNPLEAMRDLRNYGPEPESGPAIDSMTME